jgi:hypothetical protein
MSGKSMTRNPKFAERFKSIDDAFKAKELVSGMGHQKVVVGYDRK